VNGATVAKRSKKKNKRRSKQSRNKGEEASAMNGLSSGATSATNKSPSKRTSPSVTVPPNTNTPVKFNPKATAFVPTGPVLMTPPVIYGHAAPFPYPPASSPPVTPIATTSMYPPPPYPHVYAPYELASPSYGGFPQGSPLSSGSPSNKQQRGSAGNRRSRHYSASARENTDGHSSIPSQCVWVGNVAPEVTEEVFRKEFDIFGTVTQLRMFKKSRCAFVTFQTAKEAKDSLALEGKQLGSMKLTLNVGSASRHLWVGNVGPDVTEEALREAFGEFGEIESVRVLRANNCAFVNFSTADEALKAAEEMNGKALGEKELVINFQWMDSHRKNGPRGSGGNGHGNNGNATGNGGGSNKGGRGGHKNGTTQVVGQFATYGSVSYADSPSFPSAKTILRTREFQQPSRQLFVGNIGGSTSEANLWSLFSSYGELEDIKEFPDRGYAFVVFRSIHDAVWAREQMSVYPPILGGRALVVNFGKKNVVSTKGSKQRGNSGKSNHNAKKSSGKKEEEKENGKESRQADSDDNEGAAAAPTNGGVVEDKDQSTAPACSNDGPSTSTGGEAVEPNKDDVEQESASSASVKDGELNDVDASSPSEGSQANGE